MARGRFITFEGPEGGGKTTQTARLIARLEAAGIPVLYLREPGGTPTGEIIRDILQHDRAGEPLCPEAEVLLFSASRAQLVRKRILPALAEGTWVVCDRFADSTTAYQGYGRGFPIEEMIRINQFAINGAEPDVTILLDIDGTTGRSRLASRHSRTGSGPDRIERETTAFHDRVRQGYLALAERFADRFTIIDASAPEDQVAAAVWHRIQPCLDPDSP